MADEKLTVKVDAKTQETKKKFSELSTSAALFGTQVAAAASKWSQAGKAMAITGAILTAAVVVPLTSIARAATAASMEFEQAMANVRAVSQATQADFEALQAQAMDLGATTKFTATQAAEGMSMLGRAGWDAQESIEAMPGLLSLSAAGMVELSRAADIVSDVMMAFGAEASEATRFSDVFAAAASNANTTVEGLGQAMAYAAPSAAAMNIEFEQSAAALSMFADAGIKGTRAGTTMDAMLRELRNNVQDGILDFEHFAVAVYDQEGTMRDFFDIMQDIFAGMSGLTQEQRDYAASLVFSTRALRGFNVLQTAGVERMRQMESTLLSAEGAAKDMSQTMMDTLTGAITEFNSAMEGLRISIGNMLTPVITAIVRAATGLVRAINAIPGPIKVVTTVLAAKTVAVILLTTAVGALLMVAGKLPPLLATAATRAKAASVSMTAMAASTNAATAAGVRKNAQLVLMRGHYRVLARSINTMLVASLRLAAAKMRNFAATIVPSMQLAFLRLVQFIHNFSSVTIPALKLALARVIQSFWNLYSAVLPRVQLAFARLVQLMHNSLIPAIKSAGVALKTAIVANPIIAAIAAILAAFIGLSEFMRNQLLQDFTDFSDEVSVHTNEAVGQIIEMDQQVTATLMQMRHRSGEITDGMYYEMVENMNAMAHVVGASAEDMRDRTVSALEEMFAATGYFELEDQERIIGQVEEYYGNLELLMVGFRERIAELNKEIIEQGFASDEQVEEIERLNEELSDLAIRGAVESHQELGAIMQQMRAQEKARTAAHAAEMVQLAWERHDAETQAIQGSAEEAADAVRRLKGIEEEEREQLLAAIEIYRLQRLQQEKEMNRDILAEAREHQGLYLLQVNQTTGEVHSTWQQLYRLLTLPGWITMINEMTAGTEQAAIECARLEAEVRRLESAYGLSTNEALQLAEAHIEMADATNEAIDAQRELDEVLRETNQFHREVSQALKAYYEDIGIEMSQLEIDEEAARLIMQGNTARITQLFRQYRPDAIAMGRDWGEWIAEGMPHESLDEFVTRHVDNIGEVRNEIREQNQEIEETEEYLKKADEAFKNYSGNFIEETEEVKTRWDDLLDTISNWEAGLGETGRDLIFAMLLPFSSGLKNLYDFYQDIQEHFKQNNSILEEEASEIGNIMDIAMSNSVDIIRSYETSLEQAAYDAFSGVTKGAERGLEVSSPSKIERIMMDIMETSSKAMSSLDKDIKSMQAFSVEAAHSYPANVGTSAYENINTYNQQIQEGAPTINIQSMSVRNDQDIEKIAEQLHNLGRHRNRSAY